MSDIVPNYATVEVPPHVDPALVVDFDYFNPPGLSEHGDVYRAWRTLQDGPDIVWTPRNGGHWILTRAEDIKWVQENYEIFSHEEFQIPRGALLVMPPITVDPPHHSRYRAVMNPSFSKSRVTNVYEPKIRALTVDLIKQLKPRGACEFVHDFAYVMPVAIFLGIVDLPLDRREEFLTWGRGFATGREDERLGFQKKILEYLGSVLDERQGGEGDDLLTRIAGWRSNPRYQSEQETLGMAILAFVGGLDTVAAQLSFAVAELARRPELHARLRDEPELVPSAVEEFLRRHGLSSTGRLVKTRTERKGACFLPEEMVMVPIGLSGMDDRAYSNPLTIDFDRVPAPHNTFGNGPHKCVGATLARMELQVFFEEWTQRMPPVRLDPARRPTSHAGPILGMAELNITWDL
ncbi:cytochrome [Tardibacter chloracetimidivorans]|uniref:Cytochrome n=1 Tax=Tardibacter chloracetimidivorans TaxID=1921510 RepID=A0A1L3ZWC7_9SPHN|nr:cytochrome P450 [Tardibacter chloracetimidivorans]API59934.1 cytochrome [Tardibacter chloracetimidivorans]